MLVLRGGRSGPNYDEARVAETLGLLEKRRVKMRRVVVDASHDNSGKDHRRQSSVVLGDRRADRSRRARDRRSDARELSRGGSGQDLVFGQSAALSYGRDHGRDIGWEETVTDAPGFLADAIGRRNGLVAKLEDRGIAAAFFSGKSGPRDTGGEEKSRSAGKSGRQKRSGQ